MPGPPTTDLATTTNLVRYATNQTATHSATSTTATRLAQQPNVYSTNHTYQQRVTTSSSPTITTTHMDTPTITSNSMQSTYIALPKHTITSNTTHTKTSPTLTKLNSSNYYNTTRVWLLPTNWHKDTTSTIHEEHHYHYQPPTTTNHLPPTTDHLPPPTNHPPPPTTYRPPPTTYHHQPPPFATRPAGSQVVVVRLALSGAGRQQHARLRRVRILQRRGEAGLV